MPRRDLKAKKLRAAFFGISKNDSTKISTSAARPGQRVRRWLRKSPSAQALAAGEEAAHTMTALVKLLAASSGTKDTNEEY